MSVESMARLMAQLTQLADLCQRPHPDSQALQASFLQAQQTFQTQIMPLGDDLAANPGEIPTTQSILTEMNRSFRLTGMDVAFLQTARQVQTAGRRQQQLHQHVQQLLGFGQALEQALTGSETGHRSRGRANPPE